MSRFVHNLCSIALAAFALAFLPQAVCATDIPVFTEAWGPTLSDGSTLGIPDGMAIDHSGRLVVMNMSGALRVFSQDGTVIQTVATPYLNCENIEVDDLGNFYIADMWNNCVRKLAPDGSHLMTFSATPGSGPQQLYRPFATKFKHATRELYVSDQFNGRIARFTTEGVFLGQWGTLGTEAGRFYYCYGLDFNPANGDAYIVENSGTYPSRVQYFAPDTTCRGSFGEGVLNHAISLAVGIDGTVYVGDKDNSRVVMYSASGALDGTFGSRGTGAGQLRECHAIAVDDNNRVYVSDHYGKRILVFDPPMSTPVQTSTWGRLKSLYR